MKLPAQFTQDGISDFRRALLAWYEKNQRRLPWRRDRDPYRIWVSEIMLQQTRVATVVLRYEQFLERFPSLEKLASARLASVLSEWSGLGYYRRARDLHRAARILIRQHQGRFPQTAVDWAGLPGIGPYTAAAIASMAFGEPVAAVDGNAERVLGRVSGGKNGKRELHKTAREIVDPVRPGDFNQAFMELGATVCLPFQPRCPDCPISRFCSTRGPGEVRRPTARRQKREITYCLMQRGDAVFLVKRDQRSTILPGMWELPEVRPSKRKPCFSLRHAITLTDFTVHVVRHSQLRVRGSWIKMSALKRVPLTGLTRKILGIARII